MSNHALPKEQTFQTLGGRVTCQRCQAMSKRTKQQCRAPSLKGKRVCRTHGGKSTGPQTQAGRQICADARTIHGNETRKARAERSLGSARMAVLEQVGHQLGFMNGTRTRGRKPSKMSQVFPELQEAVCQLRLKMSHEADIRGLSLKSMTSLRAYSQKSA